MLLTVVVTISFVGHVRHLWVKPPNILRVLSSQNLSSVDFKTSVRDRNEDLPTEDWRGGVWREDSGHRAEGQHVDGVRRGTFVEQRGHGHDVGLQSEVRRIGPERPTDQRRTVRWNDPQHYQGRTTPWHGPHSYPTSDRYSSSATSRTYCLSGR